MLQREQDARTCNEVLHGTLLLVDENWSKRLPPAVKLRVFLTDI